MRTFRPVRRRLWIAPLALVSTVLAGPRWTHAQEDPLGPLSGALDAFLAPLQERRGEPVTICIDLVHRKKGRPPARTRLRLVKRSNSEFSLTVEHSRFPLHLHRSTDRCFLWLPGKGTLFVSEEQLDRPESAFTLDRLAERLMAIGPECAGAARILGAAEGRLILSLAAVAGYGARRLSGRAAGERTDGALEYDLVRGDRSLATLVLDEETRTIAGVIVRDGNKELEIVPSVEWGEAALAALPDAEALKERVPVARAELERTLFRALARWAEIRCEELRGAPHPDLLVLDDHGYHRVKDGQQIVKLEGTPYEVGRQHGVFLASQVRKTVDSTLYVVGLAYSIEKGEWFLDAIRSATARLDEFTPREYLEELEGLAEGSGVSYEDIRLASCFPEMFHCSGFAIQGEATVGGKLYHGRVLDYMTDIGLQAGAVLFVVEKEGSIPFCSVGYAGFVGSVSGMNARRISLGEMGGGGVGEWDGVSMSYLMRMALERASSLEEAKRVFSDSPRTCEYYYVLADGNDRSAVGVYATPGRIEFIGYGEPHERLPHPVRDCVLLSAGSRYRALWERVEGRFGRIAVRDAIELMDRPVAMKGANLHSVLFVPEDLELYVANAGRKGPAYAERFYHYSLPELLEDPEPTEEPLEFE